MKSQITWFASLIALFSMCSLPAASQTHDQKTVLLVASSANELMFKEGRPHPTGYFLDELAVPAQALMDAGYKVVIATPDGNTPALDGNSLSGVIRASKNTRKSSRSCCIRSDLELF